jgi:polyisoprenoid-binding protein YceI
MKELAFTLIITVIALSNIQAQKYYTKTGEVSFFSNTSIENIEAVSNSAATVYDAESGKLQWSILIKSFEFEKALMQEHFNENYMESSKFPKATFKGEVKNNTSLTLDKDGTYAVEVLGNLTIHGETKEVTTEAIFTVADGAIAATSTVTVLLADYKIDVPAVVRDNIAKEIKITINAEYELLDKS